MRLWLMMIAWRDGTGFAGSQRFCKAAPPRASPDKRARAAAKSLPKLNALMPPLAVHCQA
ncbi:hypothetical protein Brsp05_03989 [Brucella sp. NBRC 12953]